MNSVEIAWPMMAAACLTLGLLHLYVWHRLHQYDSLLFFLVAFSIAVFSGFELAILNASTPEAYAIAVRWAHVPITIVILSMIAFVHFNFGSGRAWLLYAACASRLLALVLNFTTGVNLNFEKITALDHVRL